MCSMYKRCIYSVYIPHEYCVGCIITPGDVVGRLDYTLVIVEWGLVAAVNGIFNSIVKHHGAKGVQFDHDELGEEHEKVVIVVAQNSQVGVAVRGEEIIEKVHHIRETKGRTNQEREAVECGVQRQWRGPRRRTAENWHVQVVCDAV